VSVLTKVFIVLLVVVALLQSAGLLVYVNQTENFKATKTAQDEAVRVATAENAALKAAATAAQTDANAARKERDDMAIALLKAPEPIQAELDAKKADLAKAEASLQVAQVTSATISKALENSEEQRKNLETLIASTRGTNDDLNKKNSDESLAIADLTNRLEVANFKVKEFTEQLAGVKAELATDVKIMHDKNIKVGGDSEAGTLQGAPPINGVVRSVSSPDGIPHATISVGTDDDVKVGMRFYVIDLTKPEKDAFLGVMTVDSVDAKEATGRLEGPNVPAIKAGVEVRTHLVG
jgi:hypothetical protein